jgi:folate-binding protein YgfZ
MSDLLRYHRSLGARLAPDGIPLDYGDLSAEHAAADQAAILLDRSHEGRILVSGDDRLNLVNRMSTNDLGALAVNDGRATIFTDANARILFRAECFERPEGLLLISQPGQGQALASFLQRNIFFGDKATVNEQSAATAQFGLHGARADEIALALDSHLSDLPAMGSCDVTLAECPAILTRRKPLSGGHWSLICAAEAATVVHEQLLELGRLLGLQPAGSLAYNILRIRSGYPGGAELSTDYIPLEVGLWDEISFSKGCYTGQEIIARMESRERVAKAMVKVDLTTFAPARILGPQGLQRCW